MRDVRFSRHRILRQEDLSRVGSGVSLDGPVELEYPILVDLNVNTHGPLDVESWNDRLYLRHAVGIRGPHSSEEGGVVGVKIINDGIIQFLKQLFKGFTARASLA